MQRHWGYCTWSPRYFYFEIESEDPDLLHQRCFRASQEHVLLNGLIVATTPPLLHVSNLDFDFEPRDLVDFSAFL
jgi:hypothetical protein